MSLASVSNSFSRLSPDWPSIPLLPVICMAQIAAGHHDTLVSAWLMMLESATVIAAPTTVLMSVRLSIQLA